MAFQYASYAIPQAPQSSLAALMPNFEAGQAKRKEEDAAQAFADLASKGPYQQPQNGQPQGGLAALDPTAGQGNGQSSGAVPDSYLTSVAKSESGGNPGAVNPTTHATGLFQFLPSTWQSVTQQHPELGLTPQGITDPGQQQKAMQAFTLDNAKQLQASGIQPTPGSLYAAHFLGAEGASKVLSAPDNVAFAAIAPQAAQANPNVAKMTVGQFKQWAAQQGGGGNGGYTPPSFDANGQPAAVGDAAQALSAYQGMGQPAVTPAPTTGAGMPVLSTAQNAPQPQPAAPQAQPQPTGAPQGANGLPSRETMLALFRSPESRPLAIAMVQAVQAGQSPAGVLDLALKQANLAKVQQEVNGGAIPDGYRRSANGGLEAIPGGPSDPNNPLNAMKTGALGATMSGNTQVSTDQNGTPNPDQQAALLQSLPPGTAELVKGIANYQLDPTKVTSLRGNQRQQLISLVSQYDPTFDMTQYPARAALRKSFTSGQYSQALNSANTLIGHLDSLSAAADELHNASFTPWNSMSNALKTVTGDPATTNFKTIADAAGNELAKVFKGTGATDMHSIEEWRSNLNADSSPEQIKGAIRTAIGDLLKSRLDTLQTQYKSAMGHPMDFNFLTPHARQALQDLGIDPSSLDPASSQQPGQGGGNAPGQPIDMGNGVTIRQIQ